MGLFRTFLRRLAGPDPRPQPRLIDLERAIEELDQKHEWLAADFRKLRGRVTGGLKKDHADAESAEQDNGDTPPEYVPPPPARIRRLRPF